MAFQGSLSLTHSTNTPEGLDGVLAGVTDTALSLTGHKNSLGGLTLSVNASEVLRTCFPLSVMGTKPHLTCWKWWHVTLEPLSLVSCVIPLVGWQP